MKRKYIAKILVIIGGFLCYMMADGITFSLGILYSEILEIFKQSKASTALLPAFIYALPQLTGPFICPFVNVIGSCYSACLGGTILAISIFVTRFVNSLQLMLVTMGIFASIGIELTYVSALFAVTKGFKDKKYLGLALGITVSGSGIGVFTFNPVLNYLIDTYTWKGALTIESSIFLHIILAGIIFKLSSAFNIDIKKRKNSNKTLVKEDIVNIEITATQDNKHSTTNVIAYSQSMSDFDSTMEINKDVDQDNLQVQVTSVVPNGERRLSTFFSMTQTKYCEPFYKPINYHMKSTSLDRRINTGDGFSVSLPVDERSVSFVRRLSLYSNHNVKGSNRGSQETLSSKPSLLFENSENDNLEVPYSRADDDPIIKKSDSVIFDKSQSKWNLFKVNLKISILSLFSLNVWANKQLLLFYLISFFFACSVVVVWTFSYDHSLLMNIDPTRASLLISLVGAGSCLGQIVFGYASEYLPAISLYALGCLFAGIVTIALRWISIYWALSILHFMFGFNQGVSYALFSLILIHYTSDELYSASLGIYLLLSGCGNLIGTSMSVTYPNNHTRRLRGPSSIIISDRTRNQSTRSRHKIAIHNQRLEYRN